MLPFATMFRAHRRSALVIAALLALLAQGCGFKGPLVQSSEQPVKKAPPATSPPAPQSGTGDQ
ncbi:MAG TPA: hypothetical protein VF104_09285 [Burkholderiales bacterium]